MAGDQKETYIRLEAIASMVTTVDVFCVRGNTVTLQPQISGISLWIKTLSVCFFIVQKKNFFCLFYQLVGFC